MKKILTVMALAIVLVWGFGVKGASATYMDPVSFYVVDDDTGSNDDNVTLTFDYYNWANGAIKLQYSLNNSTGWTDVGGSMSVTASNWQQVYLRLDLGSNTYDTDGDVTLSGLEVNSGLYNSVTVVWDQVTVSGYPTFDINISVGTANDDDNVAPVPIPAAAWLLGSGLFGLVGIRRRIKKDEEEV